jgi:hypothetical protein
MEISILLKLKLTCIAIRFFSLLLTDTHQGPKSVCVGLLLCVGVGICSHGFDLLELAGVASAGVVVSGGHAVRAARYTAVPDALVSVKLSRCQRFVAVCVPQVVPGAVSDLTAALLLDVSTGATRACHGWHMQAA